MPPDEPSLFSSIRPWERRTLGGGTAANDVEYGVDGRWWTAGFLLCAFIAFNVVGQFASTARAEVAGESFAAIPCVWLIFRQSRERVWFRAFLIFDVAVHASSYWFLPLPEHHRLSRGDVFFFQIDVLVMCGVAVLLKWLGRRTYSRL